MQNNFQPALLSRSYYSCQRQLQRALSCPWSAQLLCNCLSKVVQLCHAQISSRRQLEGSMTSLRKFTCDDLFNFNAVNLDFFTETVRSSSGHLHLIVATHACNTMSNVSHSCPQSINPLLCCSNSMSVRGRNIQLLRRAAWHGAASTLPYDYELERHV